MKDKTLRKRALRAAKAVAFGATLVMASAGCESASDPCVVETDGVCPEECTTENDGDCCEGQDWGSCMLDSVHGCSCAVPGPFVAPSMPV